ncbi:glycosyltransferase [Niveibacterium sp. SC-1]|uniref:glycosyltransferase n=1 Tax=Niveibacterium sp. SC-1 TaxID=3135646 RepID=UPI00311E9BD8
MKALHIYRTYYPETQGGLQEAIRQIVTGLEGCGVGSSVFTLAKNATPQRVFVGGAPVIRAKSILEISSCDFGSPSSVSTFRAEARRADILNFHYPWPFGDILELLGNPGKPYVITYHSDIVRQRLAEALYSPVRKRFFSKAEAIIATSPAYARTSEYLSRMGKAVNVIPLSIDMESIPAPSVDRELHWREHFPRPFFLFVGVLRYYKGLDYLIDAARETGFSVVIAGDGPEGGRLRSIASGSPNIHFLGRISDIDKFTLIRLCRGIVFPSHLRSEAFGVSLLEGAALGKPLISTELGTGTSYVNAHGETGLVVPPADSAAFSRAMRILMDNPSYAEKLGAGAKIRCAHMFATSQIGKQYFGLYEQIVQR